MNNLKVKTTAPLILILFLASIGAYTLSPAYALSPPVAIAGTDQTVEQTSLVGADVTLDGTGSYDPDGDPLAYTWTWTGGSATGPTPTVNFPPGTTIVTLEVDDGVFTDTDTILITVEDTTPPDLSVTLDKYMLWPPNHKYKTVEAMITFSDICDPSPTWTLVSVTSNEPDNGKGIGDGNTVNDIIIVDAFRFELRAERAGYGTGRIYTITYQVSDVSGNTATASATVTVPVVR